MSENHTPISRARKLRREMTKEELILWQKLRGRKFRGLKFLRQHPVVYDRINNTPKYFIPDFYCAEKKLVVEVDGKIHDFQKRRDTIREEILQGAGLRILRFNNEEISNDVFKVLRKIEAFIQNDSP
jgi:very-short-patch-repair endonuclease